MTNMIPEFSQLNHEERLCGINLLSLEMSRLRADLIEVFKIVKGIDDVDIFNPLVKRGLEVICLSSFYPVVDFILENFHLIKHS